MEVPFFLLFSPHPRKRRDGYVFISIIDFYDGDEGLLDGVAVATITDSVIKGFPAFVDTYPITAHVLSLPSYKDHLLLLRKSIAACSCDNSGALMTVVADERRH